MAKKILRENYNSFEEYMTAVNEEAEKNPPSNPPDDEFLKDKPAKDSELKTEGFKLPFSSYEAPREFVESYKTPEFEKAINEHFDLTDSTTLAMYKTISEADQSTVLSNLASRLYENIVDKVDDIDFGEIPNSKGDITKLSNYAKLMDCLTIIEALLAQFGQKLDPVLTVSNAVENIRLRKDLFEKSYKFNVEMPMIIYNSTVLAIISSVSLLIATCIEFIKEPKQDTYSLVLDKVSLNKTKQHMLFTNLEKFNRSCKSEELDKAIEFIIQNKTKNLTGTMATLGIVGAIATIGLILNIIPILREFVFFFYYSRTRVSDYFDAQADLLQINAHNVEANAALDPIDKEKIVKKQNSIVSLLRGIANKLAIKGKEGEVKATKEIVGDNKRYKAEEIMDELPDSVASSVF